MTDASDDPVLFEQRDAVALLTLNRPERLNAWTTALQDRYFGLLETCAADPTIRAIVVTGAGRGFCAGADMEDLADTADAAARATGSSRDDPQWFPTTIPKPIIAAVNGACAGLGLAQALYCDVRFAARGAVFTTAFSRRGLIAEHGIAWTIERATSHGRALDLLLSARRFSADDALAYGLVQEVVEPSDLLDHALEYAQDLATWVSPMSMAVVKSQLWRGKGLEAHTAEADLLIEESLRRPDFAEGVASFVERRPPSFGPVTDAPADGSVAGVDRGPLATWFVRHVGVTSPLSVTALQGGYSNLTFLVSDADGRRWVLRRPPLGHVLATAHDVLREARIIAALASSDVPVPRVAATCADLEVIGAPFFVMDFVEGEVVRDPDGAWLLDDDQRRAAGRSVAEVLARLHLLDVDEIGLGELGRREGYVERQLRRWHRQVHDAAVHDLTSFDAVHDVLAARVPAQHHVSLIHGDYRLDNTILGEDHTVAAVLDWELSTLGDPLADLGMTLAYWTQPGDVLGLPPVGTDVPGFPDRAEFAAVYEHITGFDMSDLGYFVALAHWKIACIAEGVYARYRAGAMGDTSGIDMQLLEGHPLVRLDAARQALATVDLSSTRTDPVDDTEEQQCRT